MHETLIHVDNVTTNRLLQVETFTLKKDRKKEKKNPRLD